MECAAQYSISCRSNRLKLCLLSVSSCWWPSPFWPPAFAGPMHDLSARKWWPTIRARSSVREMRTASWTWRDRSSRTGIAITRRTVRDAGWTELHRFITFVVLVHRVRVRLGDRMHAGANDTDVHAVDLRPDRSVGLRPAEEYRPGVAECVHHCRVRQPVPADAVQLHESDAA